MKSFLFIVFISLTLVGMSLATVPEVILLTPEEGLLHDAPAERHRSLVVNNGPDIKVIRPIDGIEQKSPLSIIVQFYPRKGTEVDLSKLKVQCLKIINVDITSRVLPYTTKDGIRVDSAELPSGKHKIRVSIGDFDGGITQKVFEVRII